MADRGDAATVARQEAVQPSLWDRLVDDLPSLSEEVDALYRDLTKRLGDADRAQALLAGGTREVARATDIDDATRQLAQRLVDADRRRSRLQESGVVVDADVMREAVRRDIEMLFNIERIESDQLLTDREALETETPASVIANFPQVRRSVLNYGVPAFSGHNGADFDKTQLSRELTKVLSVFEPRLERDSIRVRVTTGAKDGMKIEIDGVLLLDPVPERLRLSTMIDLDSGHAATKLEER